MKQLLTQEKGLIFRIVHRKNIPWILDNGIPCANSQAFFDGYVAIGNQDLIDKRKTRLVPVGSGGTLSDYVPFYFTPHSVMLYNIKTGYNNLKQRPNDEIVVVVSSLPCLLEQGVPFLFTDRHAYLEAATFFSDLNDLSQIDWSILNARDFKRDPDDPGKFERYQAEALVHHHVPVSAILGLACYTDEVSAQINTLTAARGLALTVVTRPEWYFR